MKRPTKLLLVALLAILGLGLWGAYSAAKQVKAAVALNAAKVAQ